MVRTRSAKNKDAAYASGRLAIARGFLKDARNSAATADPGDIGNATMSTVINCAIAYTDALTAKYRGEVNQEDHSAADRSRRKLTRMRPPSCGLEARVEFFGAARERNRLTAPDP